MEAWGMPPSGQRALIVQNLLLAKFTPRQPHQHSTSAILSSSLLLANADRPQTLAGGGPGQGVYSIMKALILVSSTAVSKPGERGI